MILPSLTSLRSLSGRMTVREMKMIPDEVGVVGLALLGLRIGLEVGDGNGVGIQSPQRN